MNSSKHGWILSLNGEDVGKIHRLVESYGIDAIQSDATDGEKCPLCYKTA